MNKLELQQIIIHQLEQTRLVTLSAAQRAIDAATDEETAPEHKYDTLALEASYLAHGQAMRLKECEEDIRVYRELVLREDLEQVQMTAFVTVVDEDDNEKQFFIGPRAGGLVVTWKGREVSVLTPQAPLGKALMKQQPGDEVSVLIGDESTAYEILTVC